MTKRIAAVIVAAAGLLAACSAVPPTVVAPTPRAPASPTGFIAPANDVAADLEARNDALQP